MAGATRRNGRPLVEAGVAPRSAQPQHCPCRSNHDLDGSESTTSSSSAGIRLAGITESSQQPEADLATQTTRHVPPDLHQPARMKRPLEAIDANQDPLKSKRARITVEILAARPRPSALSPLKRKPAAALLSPSRQGMQTKPLHHYFPVRPILPQPPPSIAPSPPPPPSRPLLPGSVFDAKTTTARTHSATSTAQTHGTRQLQQPTPPPLNSRLQEDTSNISTTASHAQPPVTEHHNKVVNGIEHEPDRLQPSAADQSSTKGSTGRKLRSQEATRFKSELAAYFPDYDEVIGNDPKEQHLLTTETPIIITDSRFAFIKDAQSRHIIHDRSTEDYRIRDFGDGLFANLADAQRVDFIIPEKRRNDDDDSSDPLSDSYYQPSHRKAARLEKSIRNTERSRAQHEKDQIVRILGDLQGHDWLRTMGVNGVTETRKKSFEPAREHFIRGCQAILGKFRHWSQEEKRRKLEKERALAEEEETAETGDSEDEATGVFEEAQSQDLDESDGENEPHFEAAGRRRKGGSQDIDISEEEDEESDGDPPDSSDVDASIARQLRDEAELARAKYHRTHLGKRPRSNSFAQPSEQRSPSRQRDFTSFFGKKAQRDAALSRSRRRGRSAVAWGHDVPELEEYEFHLPEELRDLETMKTRERQKRRARREAKH